MTDAPSLLQVKCRPMRWTPLPLALLCSGALLLAGTACERELRLEQRPDDGAAPGAFVAGPAGSMPSAGMGNLAPPIAGAAGVAPPTTLDCPDRDVDGYDDASCLRAEGAPRGDDCDDSTHTVHPDAPELCNGGDDDCDGQSDEAPLLCTIEETLIEELPVLLKSAAVDPAGNTYAGGDFAGELVRGAETWTAQGNRDALIESRDAAGALRWTRVLSGPGFDRIGRVVASGAALYAVGSFELEAVIGTSAGDAMAVTSFVARLDPASGAVEWIAPITLPDDLPLPYQGENEVRDIGIAVDSLGDVVVTGRKDRWFDSYGYLARFAADGTPRGAIDLPWLYTWEVGAADHDGELYLVGYSDAETAFGGCALGAGAFVMAMSGDGTCRWAKRAMYGVPVPSWQVPSPQSRLLSAFERIAVTPDRELALLGRAHVDGTFDGHAFSGKPTAPDRDGTDAELVALKLDADGNLLWIWQYVSPGPDLPIDLEIGRDGGIYALFGAWQSDIVRPDDPMLPGHEVILLASLTSDGALQWLRDVNGAYDTILSHARTLLSYGANGANGARRSIALPAAGDTP